MKTRTSRTIGLELSPSDLYPPLLATSPAGVGINTSGAPGERYDFSYTLNGQPGAVEGISLHAGPAGGALSISQQFIAGYSGSWPAALQVLAHQDGQLVDSATLTLHDTRNMVPQRVEVELLPNPVSVPFAEEQLVTVIADFFDASGVSLPIDELSIEVLLPDGVQGVTVVDYRLLVTTAAPVGDLPVTIREKSGIEQVVDLQLLPSVDIGLSLSAVDRYPPLRYASVDAIGIEAEGGLGSEFHLDFTLNGEGGRFAGIWIDNFTNHSELRFTEEFIPNYPGPWPVEVTVRAYRNAQLVGRATCRLHDTREMVCTRVDMEFLPSDRMQIPLQEETYVIAAPRFYDAAGIWLPHTELDWSAQMLQPMDGVWMDRHVLWIGPDAKRGKYRVAILGPNGLNRARVLRLV